MNRVHRFGACLAAILLLGATLCAQTFQNAGSVGAQFLKIGVGARAMGLGGAYGAMAGDPTTLAWNPAGIGTISAIDLSVQHTAWVEGINHNFVGLVVPVTDWLNLGFHTIFLSSGDIEITTIDNPEGTGKYYDATDVSAGLTSSFRLTQQLTFALTFKYVEERIYDVKAGTFAIDAGAWYSTGFRSLALGFAVTNLGFEETFTGQPLDVKYNPATTGEPPVNAELSAQSSGIPLSFRASGAFDLFEMFSEPVQDHQLLTVMDFIQQPDIPERFAAGLEYTWQKMISIRTGYLFNADELSWSLGGGVRLPVSDFDVSVDYAASSLGRFGIGHRFGIVLGYGH